jgi:hypothetical protein
VVVVMRDRSDDGAMLARFRVACVTQHLPRDVAAWLLELLDELRPAARAEARNLKLQEAASLLQGSRRSRARVLAALVAGERLAGVPAAAQAIVGEALALDPDCPRSARQLLRIAV